MVVNPHSYNRLLPRPGWGRTGSWSRYVGWSDRSLKDQKDQKQPKSLIANSVRFDESANQVVQIPPRTKEEDETRWYQESDYQEFEKDRTLTGLHYRVRRKNCKGIDEKLYCLRGLELICDSDLKKKVNGEQSLLRKRILEEKERQIGVGCHPDSKHYRELSLKISKDARQRALNLGKEDFRDCSRDKDHRDLSTRLLRKIL